MIKHKDSFLDHLAQHLGRPRIQEPVQVPTWTVSPQEEVLKDLSQEELIEVLQKRCQEIHTDFYRTTRDQLAETLQEVLTAYGAESILYARDERNEDFQLGDFYRGLAKTGLEVWEWDHERGEENIDLAERADIGISFSDITLAESATVTLFNDQDNGRVLSVLPESYIALIPKCTIVPRMTQATRQIHQANQAGQAPASCVSFISGPSNSADIEMNLIVGVHGPVRVAYIVIDDESE